MAEQLTIEHLTKVFSGGSAALSDVSIDVSPGTFLVLLGPSGSGKTTLLRSVAGIERITSGRIAIGGRAVADGRVHLPPERRDLSMVFQDYALWPHLSAVDNVAFALKRRGLRREAARQVAAEMLARVGLGALGARFPSELSGGEQQRVALARALVGDTGLVLCDEPLSNLDADLRERLRIEISSLVRAAGATALYITHDQSEAFALADQMGMLECGRLVQVGSPEEIYRAPASPFVARFTGLAGELSGVVRSRVGAHSVEVALSLAGNPVVEATANDAVEPGNMGVVMIRPSAVRLCDAGAPDAVAAGRVVDVAFRGRGYEHAIELTKSVQLNSVFSDRRSARDERVAVRLEPSGCFFFPDSDPSDEPPVSQDAPRQGEPDVLDELLAARGQLVRP